MVDTLFGDTGHASHPVPGWVCRWPLPTYCTTPPLPHRQDEEDSALAWLTSGQPWHAAAGLRRGARYEAEARRLRRELEQERQEVADLAAELESRPRRPL